MTKKFNPQQIKNHLLQKIFKNSFEIETNNPFIQINPQTKLIVNTIIHSTVLIMKELHTIQIKINEIEKITKR